MFAEIERPVVLDKSKKAVSADPLGTVAGLQFVLVFQSPEWGFCFQVALPAKEVCIDSIRPNTTKIPVMRRRGVFMESHKMRSNVHRCPELSRLFRKKNIGLASHLEPEDQNETSASTTFGTNASSTAIAP
jgi:hypothetical protein